MEWDTCNSQLLHLLKKDLNVFAFPFRVRKHCIFVVCGAYKSSLYTSVFILAPGWKPFISPCCSLDCKSSGVLGTRWQIVLWLGLHWERVDVIFALSHWEGNDIRRGMMPFFKEKLCAALVPTAQLTSALQPSSAMRQALRWVFIAWVNTHTVHIHSPTYH